MMVLASATAINAAAASEVTPSATIQQQVGKLQGTVVDASGEPIIGATVKSKVPRVVLSPTSMVTSLSMQPRVQLLMYLTSVIRP